MRKNTYLGYIFITEKYVIRPGGVLRFELDRGVPLEPQN